MRATRAATLTRCIVLVGALLLVSGCAEDEAGQQPESDRSQDVTPEHPEQSSGPVSPGPDRVRAAAVADLAGRLGVDQQEVEVVSAELVTWRDGSLGCPQPGMFYTQALVDGSRVVLEVAGERYEYHSGGARGPFLCEHPEPPLPGT